MKKLDPVKRARVREMHEQLQSVRRFLDGSSRGDCILEQPGFEPAFGELQKLVARAVVWSEEIVFLVDTEHES